MRSSHVPYFRGRKFYGKPIIEGVQHPSETIYMPNYINHAVYNLDKTVGIGDNPFYSTAIEESAFQLFRKGSNPYSYIEDLQVKPRYYPDLKGALQISKLLSLNSHHPQYTIDNPFFIAGFFTKRELRRYHDIIEQIKKKHSDWKNIRNIDMNQ